MLFLFYFEIDPKNRDASHQRLKTFGESAPDNVKPVGTWFSATLLEGWAVVEAQDEIALAECMKPWTDLNVNHITPVLTQEQVLKLMS